MTSENKQAPKPKLLLILEHSEDMSIPVGIVRDCGGSMPFDTSTCEIVGTWSRYDKGTFYIQLTNSIDALQDTLINLIKERIETGGSAVYPIISSSMYKNIDENKGMVKRTRKPTSSLPVPEVPSQSSTDFNNLRARLGR